VSIHSEHPFLPPPGDRAMARRLRGRLPAPVTVWTCSLPGGDPRARRDGWTVSSVLVADGDPAEMVALLDADADFWDLFAVAGTARVNVLAAGQGRVADAFARVAPSPGGPFRTGEWADAPYGPRLAGAAAWAGVRLVDPEPDRAGWGLLVRAVIEEVELADGVEALEHRHGRYR